MKHKLIVPSAVLLIAVIVGVSLLVHAYASKATSPSFPVGSTMAVAKAHATGTLPACLTKVASAETAMRKDDKLIDPKYNESAFDLATTMGIADVPAGTNVDTNIHSYDGKTVTGSIVYPPEYGTYNVTLIPSSSSKPYSQWTMTSIAVCKQD